MKSTDKAEGCWEKQKNFAELACLYIDSVS